MSEESTKDTGRKDRKRKKGKRKRDARTLVIFCCTCVLLLGAATFAWFSVSSSPRVTNLAMIAGTAGNLKIADAAGGPYGEELDLASGSGGNMSSVVLNPVTTQNGRDFVSPLYTDDSVTGVETIPADRLNTNYVYEKVFYLKVETENSSASGQRTFDIHFVGNRTDGGGTFISNAQAGDSAASAIRVSFTLDDGTTVIYEPNADVSVNGDRATNALASSYGGYPVLQQSNNGRFINSSDGNSETLFTMTENTPVRVTMRVWVEGTDPDCVNEISAGNITGQIRFISEEVTR